VDGEVVGILVFGLAGFLWILLPFFDQAAHGRGRKLIMGAGVFALSYIIAMTIYGYIAK
jgi:quinol-cytochrome oxidoreductase complex cytochrome b subunit